jgi:hypothetical protein
MDYALQEAVTWLMRLVAGLSQRRLERVQVGFVLDKVALGQIFLRVLRFSPVSIISPRLQTDIGIIWGMNDRPVGGGSSETQLHPVNMNIMLSEMLNYHLKFRRITPEKSLRRISPNLADNCPCLGKEQYTN